MNSASLQNAENVVEVAEPRPSMSFLLAVSKLCHSAFHMFLGLRDYDPNRQDVQGQGTSNMMQTRSYWLDAVIVRHGTEQENYTELLRYGGAKMYGLGFRAKFSTPHSLTVLSPRQPKLAPGLVY